MPACELHRIPASEIESSPLIASLAVRAEALLGYSWLRRRLNLKPSTLAVVLQELEIEPLCPEDVKRYKAERLRNAKHAVYAEYEKRSIAENFLTSLAPGTFVHGKWRRTRLRSFEGEVPEFVLSRAIEIKERAPNVEFEVEALRIDSRYDPFLIVKCGRQRFYIDVWDEAEFERQHG